MVLAIRFHIFEKSCSFFSPFLFRACAFLVARMPYKRFVFFAWQCRISAGFFSRTMHHLLIVDGGTPIVTFFGESFFCFHFTVFSFCAFPLLDLIKRRMFMRIPGSVIAQHSPFSIALQRLVSGGRRHAQTVVLARAPQCFGTDSGINIARTIRRNGHSRGVLV